METKTKKNVAFRLIIAFGLLIFCRSLLFCEDNLTYSLQNTGGTEKTAWQLSWPRRLNPVHMVIIFTKFNNEAPGVSQAPFWADELFDGSNGSVPHFFDSVSFGQYKVSGEFLPKMYEVANYSNYFDYSQAVIRMVDMDESVDFSRFDNDGPDGIPNSGDDDGYVDYIVLMPRTCPYDFISQHATGVMHMGLTEEYLTQNKSIKGERILIDQCSGCISTASNKNQAIGSIIAELSHAYGTVDLMDRVYVNPENDSAGVGWWDLLGRGALGWDQRDGPVGPCAYNRMLMNSIGPYNCNLVDIYGIHQGLRTKDVGHPDGKIFRLWITSFEYFLIEFRSNNGNNYYDRNIPESGLMIWHIDLTNSNSTEFEKLCDLECPDGRFLDKGYPYGTNPDPLRGGDNLDFWAHDDSYTREYGGNQGDATDVFDGVKYTIFGTATNPNSYTNDSKISGIEIFNIRREEDEMVFDCIVPPFPEKWPGPVPLAGLGYQLSQDESSYEIIRNKEQDFYIVSFGMSYRPDALVIVNQDSMYVEQFTFDLPHEAQKVIEYYLMNGDKSNQNSQIIRKYVSSDRFNSILKNVGKSPDDIGNGKPISWVQKITRISDSEIQHIRSIELLQNYPNPFNNHTTISYVLNSGGTTMLEVYNILGQRVKVIDRDFEEAGFHNIQLDATDLSSGMYLYRLRGRTFSQTRRFTLIK
ncbi:MAG: T9SS type A sorting domain-containing protein [Candidatus Latescibacteria bacterium]|nr:T9SS type A sorting domain-containing protein [Candidatus Latescibacterota bacterium]